MQEHHNRHPKTSPLTTRPKRVPQNKIRLWRQHRGLTTEQVASRAVDAYGKPMTASLISQVEVGRCAYTQNSLERIAKALDVEAWMLLAVDPADQTSWLILQDNADFAWRNLPLAERSEAAAFLRDMVEAIRDVMQRRWPGIEHGHD